MAAIQAITLTEPSQLEERVRKLSFTMTALEFVTSWRRKSVINHNKDIPSHDCIISLEQVSHHDTSNDCWIILYDRVYDVTTFLKQHPGGADVLLEYAGRDATLAFRGTGHTAQAVELIKPFLIGHLPFNERIYRKEGGIRLNGIPD